MILRGYYDPCCTVSALEMEAMFLRVTKNNFNMIQFEESTPVQSISLV